MCIVPPLLRLPFCLSGAKRERGAHTPAPVAASRGSTSCSWPHLFATLGRRFPKRCDGSCANFDARVSADIRCPALQAPKPTPRAHCELGCTCAAAISPPHDALMSIEAHACAVTPTLPISQRCRDASCSSHRRRCSLHSLGQL